VYLSLKNKIGHFLSSEIGYRGIIISFLLGFLVRLVPEILSYPNIIGFDTVRYATVIKEGVIWYHWTNIFSEPWFLYALIIPLDNIINLTPSLTLKVTPPFLYGLNVAGIYFFANKTLKWEPKKCLFASFLFSLSIASLRISWDLPRNTLGLAMLLFSSSLIPEAENGKRVSWLIALSTLTVFSHELTAVILLVSLFWLFLKNMKEADKGKALRLFVPFVSCLIIFLTGIYLKIAPVYYEIKDERIILYAYDSVETYPLGFIFLSNYLVMSTPVEQYGTYMELVINILSLFSLLYIVWLPLLIKGFKRNRILDIWTAFLILASFSPIITPFCAPIAWNRWILMLVYPFTFYTTNGLEKILNKEVRPNKIWKKLSKTIVASTILMSILFMALPSNLAIYGIPTTTAYFPSSMQQNTVPLEDVEGTIQCLKWLNGNMNKNSTVLVHHAFLSWAKLYLDRDHIIVYYSMNITKALEVAKKKGFDTTYLIWWTESIGWYPNIKVPEAFEIVNSSGRISIYRYV